WGEVKDWCRFWKLVRTVGPAAAKPLLKDRDGWWVKCRSAAGSFEAIHDLLLPGEIAELGDGSAAAGVIDIDHHKEDEELLRSLGAAVAPYEIARFRPSDCYANDIYAEHATWADSEYR